MAGCHMIPSEPRPLIKDNAELEISPVVRFGERRHLLGIRAGHRPLRAATPLPSMLFGNRACKKRADIQRCAHETIRPHWL